MSGESGPEKVNGSGLPSANRAAESSLVLPTPRSMLGLGTFMGVFTPTLLTILGLILFLRLGWVVGNAGIIGTLGILGLAMGLTFLTGLSLSSIATNTRVGAGGPYAMITRSLGFEVGGSIGIPLYLARPLGVAMFIFGFREGWLWVFPAHSAVVVDVTVFVLVFGLAFLSSELALKIEGLVLALIGLALISIVASPRTGDVSWSHVHLLGNYPGFPESGFSGVDFWVAFAVFFPASTGLLAGANMSGELRDPRRSIPSGTLWAVGVGIVIYLGLAVWTALVASPHELVGNYYFYIDAARWSSIVVAGLLGATFSAAVAAAIGGPRILMAMGEHRLIPGGEWLAERKRGGEPRNSVALTATLTLACLMVRDLNAIAPLVTMFFLITYFTINAVLFIETAIGLVSFRPTLSVPIWVPFLGATGSIFTMFVVNATFGFIAIGCVFAIYWYIANRKMPRQGEDVRSSIFTAIAEWATGRARRMGGEGMRGWKPSALVPVEDPCRIRGEYDFILDTMGPEGTVKLLGVTTRRSADELRAPLEELTSEFLADGLFCATTVLEKDDLEAATADALQTLQSAYFKPNLLLLTLPAAEENRDEIFVRLTHLAHRMGIGVMILGLHPEAHLGSRRTINVWVHHARYSWEINQAFEENNLDLELLMAYRMMRRWSGPEGLRLLTAVPDETGVEPGEDFLAELAELARIPEQAERRVLIGPFTEAFRGAPPADLQILGLRVRPDLDKMREAVDAAGSSCLFVEDSGRESARV